MNRGILIAGNESALTNAVETETAKRAESFAVALIPDRFSGKQIPAAGSEDSLDQSSSEKGRFPLDWNPGSPISARTLIIAAENRLQRIDGAILVCDPPSVHNAAAGRANLDPADVDMLFNDHIKGWFFLVKELAAVFKARGEGILALVYPETNPKDDDTDLLKSAALASFRSLTAGLLSGAADEPYHTIGFAGIAAGDEAGFASFIIKQIDDVTRRGYTRPQAGKLHKYGKLGFFR